ncbi:MAG: glutamine--fructose-6-phosphate transaminase (isomerizing) [Candidatus Micrarchaeota archaeon]
MCGIIGYVGYQKADEVLISGLERLEYRGYDSAGICVCDKKLQVHKVVGRVENLKTIDFTGNIGIAHTRWATHGKPTVENAHPHMSANGKIAVVHNGIVENYLSLKEELRGVTFKSETDTEIIAHLIEKFYSGDLKDAVLKVINKMQGSYAICVLMEGHDELIFARNGSPLILGVGSNENFVASDVAAFVEHTKKVIYLDDLEMGVLHNDGFEIFDNTGKKISKEVSIVDWDLAQAQKSGHPHFMLKEILEQPTVVEETLKVNIDLDFSAKRIFMVACGTASYAGFVGKYLIEKIARIPVEWMPASEFRYSDPIIGNDDLMFVISQSGETADTLAALRLAKEKGARVVSIVNVVNSTIARESDSVIYTRAGPEIGVASTKAYLAQLVILYKIAEKMGGKKLGLDKLPSAIKEILSNREKIKEIAKKYFLCHNLLFIGRGINYPIAIEGSHKLKEISYIHAEAYAAGELKHGAIALVTEDTPTIVIATDSKIKEKLFNNIQEVKARNGKTIAIASNGDELIKKYSDDVFYVPKVDEILTPILTIIPLQLFAYYIADMRECDIDKPRNLAKSVTVE